MLTTILGTAGMMILSQLVLLRIPGTLGPAVASLVQQRAEATRLRDRADQRRKPVESDGDIAVLVEYAERRLAVPPNSLREGISGTVNAADNRAPCSVGCKFAAKKVYS